MYMICDLQCNNFEIFLKIYDFILQQQSTIVSNMTWSVPNKLLRNTLNQTNNPIVCFFPLSVYDIVLRVVLSTRQPSVDSRTWVTCRYRNLTRLSNEMNAPFCMSVCYNVGDSWSAVSTGCVTLNCNLPDV